MGFFNSVGGKAEDFLLHDDVENTCLEQVFGVGDGISTDFQLVRSLPDWVEPVQGIVEPPQIFIDGIETTAFTCNANGVVIFEEAPAAGSVLSWSGIYYFRVRFDDDEIELSRTYEGLWESVEVNFITVK